jgi:hypothetical protein
LRSTGVPKRAAARIRKTGGYNDGLSRNAQEDYQRIESTSHARRRPRRRRGRGTLPAPSVALPGAGGEGVRRCIRCGRNMVLEPLSRRTVRFRSVYLPVPVLRGSLQGMERGAGSDTGTWSRRYNVSLISTSLACIRFRPHAAPIFRCFCRISSRYQIGQRPENVCSRFLSLLQTVTS